MTTSMRPEKVDDVAMYPNEVDVGVDHVDYKAVVLLVSAAQPSKCRRCRQQGGQKFQDQLLVALDHRNQIQYYFLRP